MQFKNLYLYVEVFKLYNSR